MSKESEFRKLLKKVDQEYFNKRNRPNKLVAPFLYETDTTYLVDGKLPWLKNNSEPYNTSKILS